jgi:phosphoribosylformylglycinamidine cyclo-ligase
MAVTTYKESGVSIDANTRWVAAIRSAVTSTYGPRVCGGHGGFAGLFRLDHDEQLFRRNYRKPVLVGCTDGVGTKVLLAVETDRLDTIGIDLVAMNVNDLITCGAEPLFFLDYLAVNRLEPPRLKRVIEGIAAGCREAGCALLGGETAEMPDLYRAGHIDLAGFAVGVVELDRTIDGSRVAPGDVLVGLGSSGVHSNGYTLVRRLIADHGGDLNSVDSTLGEPPVDALTRPTRIYVRAVHEVLRAYPRRRIVMGMAHVTGGGLKENVARALPPGCDAVIDRKTWRPPPVFDFIRRLGVHPAEMFRVFNMGIGFVLIVRPRFASGVLRVLTAAGERPTVIGEVRRGSGKVLLR